MWDHVLIPTICDYIIKFLFLFHFEKFAFTHCSELYNCTEIGAWPSYEVIIVQFRRTSGQLFKKKQKQKLDMM